MHRHHDESVGEVAGPSEYDRELELIKASVGDDEEGELVNLARIALNSPIGDVAANILAQSGDDDDGEWDSGEL